MDKESAEIAHYETVLRHLKGIIAEMEKLLRELREFSQDKKQLTVR